MDTKPLFDLVVAALTEDELPTEAQALLVQAYVVARAEGAPVGLAKGEPCAADVYVRFYATELRRLQPEMSEEQAMAWCSPPDGLPDNLSVPKSVLRAVARRHAIRDLREASAMRVLATCSTII